MTSTYQPSADLLTITSPEQYRALGHPLRHRLLFALGQQPATISQLAGALDSHKGNIAHHLKVLRDAGLVAVTHTRQVRGGTEQYYQRTARRLQLDGEHAAAGSAVMLQAIAGEVATAAGQPLLTLRNIRLTSAQAEQLAAELSALAERLDDAARARPGTGCWSGSTSPGRTASRRRQADGRGALRKTRSLPEPRGVRAQSARPTMEARDRRWSWPGPRPTGRWNGQLPGGQLPSCRWSAARGQPPVASRPWSAARGQLTVAPAVV